MKKLFLLSFTMFSLAVLFAFSEPLFYIEKVASENELRDNYFAEEDDAPYLCYGVARCTGSQDGQECVGAICVPNVIENCPPVESKCTCLDFSQVSGLAECLDVPYVNNDVWENLPPSELERECVGQLISPLLEYEDDNGGGSTISN